MSSTAMWRWVFILPVLIVWSALPGAARAEPKHPHMHQALFELRESRTELKEASHDFGGHRAEALKALDVAIAEMEIALVSAGDKYKTVTPEKDWYKKFEFHPHIHRAIVELKEARTELKEAKHDFGGHREKAVKDVNYAIEQLEVALKFAKK